MLLRSLTCEKNHTVFIRNSIPVHSSSWKENPYSFTALNTETIKIFPLSFFPQESPRVQESKSRREELERTNESLVTPPPPEPEPLLYDYHTTRQLYHLLLSNIFLTPLPFNPFNPLTHQDKIKVSPLLLDFPSGLKIVEEKVKRQQAYHTWIPIFPPSRILPLPISSLIDAVLRNYNF
ncbi:hypothetical protein EYC84_001893 [Monilinia fructicola]|uniref:Uncharacterized protein n=1 Tax=Monilinia fructicola TaxID=38448 RepID=A0A5M9JTK6_MONFR|nr:hypothetical protein EYC84_001893 [Monilinia fructicola]